MDSDRWARLERLFHEALQRPPQDRDRFLDEACADDAALRADVQALIDTPASAARFLESPAIAQLAAGVANPPAVALTGRQLGVYVVGDRIGAGGMGEVYRAHDTKLGRDVALKFLPAALAGDADRLARFRREARVLAALNHPNVAQIYGLEEVASADAGPVVQALAMELVEGPTLADRIARGPIPVEEALAIARQMAAALEVAHEQGIVHRDLKPANVKVREDGTVKVLDFGLAKALAPEAGGRSAGATQSPTITSPAMTEAGIILGTAAYMSPEQARGRPVDRRADIWAFGVVLFEMLTGRRAFSGDDVSDVLAKVITSEPAWNALPPGLSPVLDTFLRRCLHKDPRQRLHDIADMRLALEGAFDAAAGGRSDDSARTRQVARFLPAAVAGAVAVLATAAVAWTMWPAASPRAEVRFEHRLPEGQRLVPNQRSMVIVAPDGASFVYRTNQGLFRRDLSDSAARLITGTEGLVTTNPFFSGDGLSVGFWAQTAGIGSLMRIPVDGGTPQPVASASFLQGASWDAASRILFAQAGGPPSGIPRSAEDRSHAPGIYSVAATAGSNPTLVIPARDGETLLTPQLLPDGQTVLFSVRSAGGASSAIAIQSLGGEDRKVVVEAGTAARYLPSGHVVYAVEGDMFGVTFDLDSMTATSAPVLLETGLAETPAGLPYDISNGGTGTLVFVPGQDWSGTPVLVDRRGIGIRSFSDAPLEWPRHPALDPAGERLALIVGPPGESRVWIYYLDNRPPEAVTFTGDFEVLVWSPTGDRLAVGYAESGVRGVYTIPASGDPSVPERFFVSPDNAHVHPQAWIAGEIVVMKWRGGTDLLAVSTNDPGKVRELATSPDYNEYHGRLSPNGRCLAYGSLQLGPSQIYLRSFAASDDGGRRVSAVSGNLPLWARDGTELFYHRGGQAPSVLAVPVDTSGSICSFGTPVPVFDTSRFDLRQVSSGLQSFTHVYYDVDAIGNFVMIERESGTSEMAEVVVVLNWFDKLRRLLPIDGS